MHQIIRMIVLSFAAPALSETIVALSLVASAANVSGLGQVLSPSFAGLGIEPSNLFSFTGAETVNTLSVNLIANLGSYTGVPPHIRIGGNTEDNALYNASYDGYDYLYDPNHSGQGAIASDFSYFGPKYFECLDRFPKGTPITFGLNLAYDNEDAITHIVAEADAVLTQLTNVDVVSFEIGNEPDLYLDNGFRNGTWDGTVYAEQWVARASAIYEQVMAPKGLSAEFFEPGCTANTISTTFTNDDLNETVITAVVNGTKSDTFVAGYNQHDYYYYIGVSTYTLTLDILMDLATTASQFYYWISQVQEATALGKSYYLREMASVGPTGETGITDVFGATLWQLNFFLYTASLNVSSVGMHMTDDSYAAPWAPIEYGDLNITPHVRTTYYAFAAMAQLIGTGCTTQIVELTVPYPTAYVDRLGAYASYQADKLAAVVLLNTLLANASDTDKGSVTFNLTLPDYGGETLYLSYLTAAGADSMYNTTWNGISYEQTGDGIPTTVNSTVESVVIGSDGTVSVPVRDTQAVIANIGFQLGSKNASTSACEALAKSGTEAGADVLEVTASATVSATETAAKAGSTSTASSQSSSSSSSTGAAAVMATMMPLKGMGAIGVLLGAVVAFV